MKCFAFLLVCLITACSGEGRNVAVVKDSAAPVPDSLVLTLADSAQVWLTGGMLDTGASGDTCRPRNVEIRRRDSMIPVPLLFTLGTPEMENDSTLRAPLVRDCLPVDEYRISVRTGQPTRVK
jgi:hypothetical protein